MEIIAALVTTAHVIMALDMIETVMLERDFAPKMANAVKAAAILKHVVRRPPLQHQHQQPLQ